ncbi:MAG: NAD-dependent epimerase/dehydratase family protein [Acidobacteriota bacterium]|nr:NAD-dependent epimerase/dehydratase family protein [Acidobacteriota bacterium]
MDDFPAWNERRVLVTGAAGFIGRRLATRLAAAGARVTGFDRIRPSVPETNMEFHEADLRDTEALGDAVGEADVVFHLAAANGHRASMDEPRADFEDNVMGTVSLLAAVARRAPRARVALASTRQLYGRAESLPADEGHTVAPPDIHAIHKETAEHLVRHGAEERGAPFSILRLTNTYGPGQPTAGPAAGLTGRLLGDALAEREITILGDPGLLRDFNYVDDVVDSFVRAGEPGAPPGTWNLGAAPIRLREFAEAVFRALGQEPRVRSAPLPPGFEAIAIGDFHSDWSAIRRDLGWKPAWTLESGLAETVRSMRPETS